MIFRLWLHASKIPSGSPHTRTSYGWCQRKKRSTTDKLSLCHKFILPCKKYDSDMNPRSMPFKQSPQSRARFHLVLIVSPTDWTVKISKTELLTYPSLVNTKTCNCLVKSNFVRGYQIIKNEGIQIPVLSYRENKLKHCWTTDFFFPHKKSQRKLQAEKHLENKTKNRKVDNL